MTAAERTLLLSFASAVPLSVGESATVFDRARANGLLKPLDGRLGTEWRTVERFLATYPEPPARHLLVDGAGGSQFTLGIGERIVPCSVIVTWHPAYSSMTLIVTTNAVGEQNDGWHADVDLTIAVLHCLQGRPSAVDSSGEHGVRALYRGKVQTSGWHCVLAAFDELTRDCGISELPDRKAWCVEIRGYDGSPPGKAVGVDPRPFYGLATSDEGWRFVPRQVAREALGEPWGTREFVSAYAMASGIICLNNKGAEYAEAQRALAMRYFGAAEPYFDIDSAVAGLDHGMLLVLERVLIRMALAIQWLHRAQEESAGLLAGTRSVNDKHLLRGSLDILEMANSALPAEVNLLEQRLAGRMGIDRIIQQLDRHAEAIDDETRYAYESSVNALVTRLTWVAVGLTVITIVLGVLQIVYGAG